MSYLNGFLQDFDRRFAKIKRQITQQNTALNSQTNSNPLLQNYPPNSFTPQSPMYLWLYEWVNQWLSLRSSTSSSNQSQG